MITGAASGIIRSIMVTPNNRADIIPVDVAINLVIISSTKTCCFSLTCYLIGTVNNLSETIYYLVS